MSNPLETYFRKSKGRLIHKWVHYFDIYDRHFSHFRGKRITILEFGVQHGGSLQMWKHYFGRKARIIGVDIDPRCKKLIEKQIEVYIGDQENRKFLKSLAKKVGPFDIVIDDGGHTMGQQITTFEEIFPNVKDNGVFLVEDLHTSYWKEYGGGYKKQNSFIEFAKNLIDQINAWHSLDENSFFVDKYTETIKGMHVYDSIIVFDKGILEKPHHEQIGIPSF